MDKSSLLVDALQGRLPTEVEPDHDLVFKLDEGGATSRLLETEHGTGAYENGGRWRVYTFPPEDVGPLPSPQVEFLSSVPLLSPVVNALVGAPQRVDDRTEDDAMGEEDVGVGVGTAAGTHGTEGAELAVSYVLHSKEVSQKVLDQLFDALLRAVAIEEAGAIAARVVNGS